MSSTVVITLDSSFSWVIFASIGIVVECLFIGFGIAGKARSKIFTKEFMEKNFGAEHKEAFGTEIQAGGYPDSGNGRYAKQLPYADWIKFNLAQRAHMNFVENIGCVVPCLLMGGLKNPVASAILGGFYFLSRLIYAIGYTTKGPIGRLAGFGLALASFLGLFIVAIISSVQILQG